MLTLPTPDVRRGGVINSKPKVTSLKKDLGGLDVFAIASGAMISSGLFVLPGVLYAMTGPSVWLAYLIAALLVLPALFCKAELATAMPKAGGTYYFIDRALGPAVGMIGGFAAWFSLSLKTAFALFGVGAFCLLLDPTFTSWKIKAVAVVVTLFVTSLNVVGVKSAARAQNLLVGGLLVALAAYVVVSVPQVDLSNFDGSLRAGWGGLAMATGTAFVAFGGLTKAAAVAEEISDPGAILPRAMLSAYGIVTLLYIGVVVVTVGVLGDSLAGDLNPISHGAERVLGRPGLIAMSIAALIAYLSTANAGIMAASRVPMAMSRDDLLPGALAKVNTQYGTPTAAIAFTSIFIVASIVFLDLETLVKTASVMKILLFMSVSLAVILMRESRVEFYRPTWRVPGYPWVPGFGVVAYGLLCFQLGTQPLLLAGGLLLAGLVWYHLYARIRVNRESAIVHVVGRFARADIGDAYGLEAELRDVLRERDWVEVDGFDELVGDSVVLEVGPTDLAGVSAQVGRALEPIIGLEAERFTELLLEHEERTLSVMVSGLAVPVIEVPGENHLKLVLVRSIQGIAWPDSTEPVRAVCVLATSAEHRHERLRVLTFLAQISHDPEFGQRWMRVRSVESLRELLLLSKRHRGSLGTSFLLVD